MKLFHRIALALPLIGLASGQEPDGSDPPMRRPIEFLETDFDEAAARAKRLGRHVVVVWHDADTVDAPLTERVFSDRGVIDWVRERAIAVRIDVNAHPEDARTHGVPPLELPVVDVVDVERSERIERLRKDAGAVDLLASVYGIEAEADGLERPVNGVEKEPFVWLAWANARFRSRDADAADDALFGYAWCLHVADDERPGFRARYLEFLLRRVAECKPRSQDAVRLFEQEHRKLAGRMRSGSASRRDVIELGRVHFWYRKPTLTEELFLELRGRGPEQDRYLRWMLPDAIAILGRSQEYGAILEALGEEPVAVFRDRVAAFDLEPLPLAEELAAQERAEGTHETREPGPERPLAYTEPDVSADVIFDASWAFEALLSTGRGKDAADLRTFVTTTYPTDEAYVLFVERAMRLELHALALEIAESGTAVLDDRGRRRLERWIERIHAKWPKEDRKGDGGDLRHSERNFGPVMS